MDVKCERNARFGYCFRVSSRYHNEVESIPDVSVLQVLKNGIYFTLDGSTFPLGRFMMGVATSAGCPASLRSAKRSIPRRRSDWSPPSSTWLAPTFHVSTFSLR